MNKSSRKLLPLRTVDENDIINEYALAGVTEQGTFVKISSGSLTDGFGQVGASFGAAFDGTSSPQWGTKNQITEITSGDLAVDVLGITLYNVLAVDENGENLKYNKQKREELHAVLIGDSVPVAQKGRFILGPEAFEVVGAAPDFGSSVMPAVGDRIVPSNNTNGKVDIVPKAKIVASPADATEYTQEQVLGTVIATGDVFNGSVGVLLG